MRSGFRRDGVLDGLTQRMSTLARRGMGRRGIRNATDHRVHYKPGVVAGPCVLKERLSSRVDRVESDQPRQSFPFVWCFIVYKGLSHLLAHELGED